VGVEPPASVVGTVGGVVAFVLFSLVVFLALGLGPSPTTDLNLCGGGLLSPFSAVRLPLGRWRGEPNCLRTCRRSAYGLAIVLEHVHLCIRRAAARTPLDRGPYHLDRVSLG